MPFVPVPPPPAPYIAPDLHPIAARSSAAMIFVRDAKSGRVVDSQFQHDLWLAAEGAPLEVRFHKDDDGTTWAEQAFYANGDRRDGTASVAASAYVARIDQVLNKRRMGTLSGVIRYVIRTSAGKVVRSWRTDQCPEGGVVRLDRPTSPVEPTFPSSWGSCARMNEYGEENEGEAYERGRIDALDRGWATRAPGRIGVSFKPLKPGRYRLEMTIDPDALLADADRSNNSTTIDLRVRETKRTRLPNGVTLPANCDVRGDEIYCGGEPTGIDLSDLAPSPMPGGASSTTPAAASARAQLALLSARIRRPRGSGPLLSTTVRPVGRSTHSHAATEPEAFGLTQELRRLEEFAARDAARAEGGRRPRVGEPAPPAPEGVDLPNLRSAPSYGISTDTARIGKHKGKYLKRDLLTFGALTWNAGPGKLEVEAFRETGTTLSAYQVFFADGERASRQARGTLIWHAAPGHNHFHFQAFAHYTLRSMDGRVARDSGKSSWCIVDTNSVDSSLPGVPSSAAMAEQDASSNCGSDSGSLWARLGMTVGSGDYYSQDIAGQAFDITKLKNGPYRIVIAANPDRLIAESNYDDNVSQRTVILGGKRGRRTVRVLPHPLINARAEDYETGMGK